MFSAPGVAFQPLRKGRPPIAALRTDVAGFIGYTLRGPLLSPVKLTSRRQFTAVFGEPLEFGHLGYAVSGFFANGGAACYVIRIASDDVEAGALEASAVLFDQSDHSAPQAALRLFASHGELFDPVVHRPLVENGRPVRRPSPGSWGNRLTVSLFFAGLGTTTTDVLQRQPADGRSSSVIHLGGFELGSIVRLRQTRPASGTSIDPQPVEALVRIAAIDAQGGRLFWYEPLADLGLDVSRPIQLETVEFTLIISVDGQIAERHDNLSLSFDHSRFVTDILRASSTLVDVEVLIDDNELLEAARLPAPVDGKPLAGGRDGLAAVSHHDYLKAIAALESIDELSLVAAPDVVLAIDSSPATPSRKPPARSICSELDPPRGQLHCLVLAAGREAETPLPGVKVTLGAGSTSGALLQTDASGRLDLQGLPVGLLTLSLQKDGFLTLETSVDVRENPPLEPSRFFLAEIALPPTLPLDDVFAVQAAMLAQCAKLRDRVALLDAPASMLGVDEIQTWRSRFDANFGALYYPWLLIADAPRPAMRAVPPSGHVAGMIAKTDLTRGVFQAPANFVIDGVSGLSHLVDEALQGLFNAQGINCLRVLPGRGIRVFGARTLSSDPEWRYLNVRRVMSMIEESIEDAHQWAVFEPNNAVLRRALTHSLTSLLHALWRQGALAGDTADAAFRVKCDDTNNPAGVVEVGQLVAEIAVAPTIPFEFIRFRLGRTFEAVEITE